MSASQGRERYAPIYTVAEAARMVGIHPLTVRRWMFNKNTAAPPPLTGGDGPLLLSFLSVIEIVVAKSFRRLGFQTRYIREARDYALERLEVDYPFASLRLRTAGCRVLAEWESAHPSDAGSMIVLKRHAEPGAEQWSLPNLVQEAIAAIEFASDELAERWYPMGKDIPIVVDPRFAAGRPVIDGTRVSVEAVNSRIKQNLPREFIMDDLRVNNDAIDAVERFVNRAA